MNSKRLRQRFSTVFFVLALFTLCPFASADTGPKPSVVINLSGFNYGEKCYVTLLSSESSTGPFNSYKDGAEIFSEQGSDEYSAFMRMTEYPVPSGYYLLNYIGQTGEDGSFTWGYYPPEKFRMLCYFPQTDSFAISEPCERYAFDSYYKAEIKEENIITLTKSSGSNDVPLEKDYNFFQEAADLLLRIIITIVLELLIARLFGIKAKAQLRFIMLVNIVTQLVLNIALNLATGSIAKSAALIYITLELAVIVAESVLYGMKLSSLAEECAGKRKLSTFRCVFYSITANLISFVFGYLLSGLIPAIF